MGYKNPKIQYLPGSYDTSIEAAKAYDEFIVRENLVQDNNLNFGKPKFFVYGEENNKKYKLWQHNKKVKQQHDLFDKYKKQKEECVSASTLVISSNCELSSGKSIAQLHFFTISTLRESVACVI